MPVSQKIQVHTLADSYEKATHIVGDQVIDPAKGQIRVRNLYAGVNGLFDHMAIQGKIGYISLVPPFDLGVESIGIVEAVGETSDFSVGDAVATTGLGSAYRHRQVIESSNAYPIPSCHPKYLAIVPTGVSALVALEQVAQLKPGETIAITAAAGGLGHIWVQLAANLGCQVIGIAGSDEKCELVEALGAKRCINYKKESVEDILSADYQDAIDVAVDTVGGTLFDALLDNIAPLGRLVVSGYASEIVTGAKPVKQARVYEKIYWKGASIRGFMNGLLKQYHREAAMRLFDMMETGSLRVSIDPTSFKGLEALPDAANHMMKGHNIGRPSWTLHKPLSSLSA